MANIKVVKGSGVPVTLWLDEALVARLDKLALKTKLSRSRLARNLLECGLEDAELLDTVGLFTLIAKYESLKAILAAGGDTTALPA